MEMPFGQNQMQPERQVEMKRVKQALLILLLCVFLGTMAFSGYQIMIQLNEYHQGEDYYAGLQEVVSLPSPVSQDETAEEPGQTAAAYPQIDFSRLRESSPDVTAWIYGEETGISYPVVQGEDNSYYLNHMADGAFNSAGSIFLDCRNQADYSDRHSIIYGHHMKNDTMFFSLTEYASQEYYEEHPRFWLILPDQAYTLEWFSGYVASVEENAWQLSFESDAAFGSWLTEILGKSAFLSGVTPTEQDTIVTLSTCNNAYDDERFVLHGVLRPVR